MRRALCYCKRQEQKQDAVVGGPGPMLFTELGVAMLSSVLNSERAVEMNMIIMRAFVRLREMIAHNRDIAVRVEKRERSHGRTASVIEVLVEDIDRKSV